MSKHETVDLKISAPTDKARLTKARKKFGDETLTVLLDRARAYDELTAEVEKLTRQLHDRTDTIQSLQGQLQEKQHAGKQEDADPNLISALSEALTSLTGVNKAYAKENDRLLKIANLSEYDERINSLKDTISQLEKDLAKKTAEFDSRGDKIKDLELQIESARGQHKDLEFQLGKLQDAIAGKEEQLAEKEKKLVDKDNTISSIATTNERHRAEIDSLKNELDLKRVEIARLEQKLGSDLPPAGEVSDEGELVEH